MGWALAVDGLIIIFYFISITAIGLYMGRRESNLEDYALGGRRMPWWAVMASIIAAETSAATFLTVPGEGFKTHSLHYMQLAFGLILGRILVGYVFLKPYYLYRVYTVYDFLAIRFGNKSRNYASVLFLIMRTLAIGVRVFVPSIVMVLAWRMFVQGQQIKDLGVGDSWHPYAWAIIILVVVTCAYTAFGGIKAVIWTDVIQAALMFTSGVVAIGSILYQIGHGSIMGGFHAIAAGVPEMTKLSGYIAWGGENAKAGSTVWEIIKLVIANPYTLAAVFLAGPLGNMAAFGTDQDMVQRMLTAKDYKKSRRSLITSAFMDIPIFAVFTGIGVLLIIFYKQHPELAPMGIVKGERVIKPNDVFGAYILNVMPVVIRGFILAGLFATAMGSLSAALNALATSFTNDWYIPFFGKRRGESHYIGAARFFTGVFAVLMIVIATVTAYASVVNPEQRLIPIALGVAGLFLGPMGGVFLLGMITKRRGSDLGNVISMTIGLVSILFLSGQHIEIANVLFAGPGYKYVLPGWMPPFSFTWFSAVGTVVTFAVGVLFETPPEVVRAATERAQQAHEEGSKPLALR